MPCLRTWRFLFFHRSELILRWFRAGFNTFLSTKVSVRALHPALAEDKLAHSPAKPPPTTTTDILCFGSSFFFIWSQRVSLEIRAANVFPKPIKSPSMSDKTLETADWTKSITISLRYFEINNDLMFWYSRRLKGITGLMSHQTDAFHWPTLTSTSVSFVTYLFSARL